MSLAELLPEVETLSREDKMRLISFVEKQLAEETPILPNGEYPVWSPYESYEAAARLLDVLKTGKDTQE